MSTIFALHVVNTRAAEWGAAGRTRLVHSLLNSNFIAVLSCSTATKRIENRVWEDAEIAKGQELLLLAVAMINDIFTHLWKLMWCRELGELWTVKTYKTHYFRNFRSGWMKSKWHREMFSVFCAKQKETFSVTRINHQRVIYHSAETFGLLWLFCFFCFTEFVGELEAFVISFHSCSFCTHHHLLVRSPGIVCRLGEENDNLLTTKKCSMMR